MLFLKLRCKYYKEAFARGYRNYPILYTVVGLYFIYVLPLKFVQWYGIIDLSRFRKNYAIVRPNDTRLRYFPRHFISDQDVLENYEKRNNLKIEFNSHK